MIQTRTMLNVADNSGARQAMCIKVLGSTRNRYANIGDVIKVSIKEVIPDGKVKKSDFMHKIKKGDEVIVLTGKSKGLRGKVLRVVAEGKRAVVEGVNLIKKH